MINDGDEIISCAPDMTDNIQHDQILALRKENHQLREKINYEKERKMDKKKKLQELEILVNDASIRLNEGSELIRKLQQHLKICQEKLSDKTKALLMKDDAIRDYQLYINHLNERIRQLTDEYTAQDLQFSLKLHDNPKVDVAIQTSPALSIQRRSVRFNLDVKNVDKENLPIDSKYFQPMNNRSK